MPYKNLDSEAGGIGGPSGKLYTDEKSPGKTQYLKYLSIL
jgi:hypothetical protein